jgi:hypothetical protein
MTINPGRYLLGRRILGGTIAAGALLGLMATAPSTFASQCRQPAHVWFGPNPVPQFGQIFLTGVTCPNTPARFIFRDGANVVWDPVTQRSRGNCVIHHEPEFRTVHLAPGTYFVTAQFWDEFCNFKVAQLGAFTVTRAACHVGCDQGTLDPDTCSCQCFEGAEQNCWSQGGNWDSSTCTCRTFEPLRPGEPGPAEPESKTSTQP